MPRSGVLTTMRTWLVAVALGLLAACGGSDGSDGSGGGGSTSPPPPPPPAPAGNVTISGKITYDFVPAAISGGLDYGAIEARPARAISVQFIETSTGATLSSTVTNSAGDYSLSVGPNRTGFVRARARSTQSGAPGWDFQVVDNTSGNALYTLDGASLSSGTVDSVRDQHAPAGWTGASYGDPRAAAPFAILDTIYSAVEYLLLADGSISFPPLEIHWSPDNVATFGADGESDPATGEIGTSYYGFSPSQGLNGIYLLGDEDNDTEEYDPHLILHEFGHYLEYQLGRSDSIGGPHARGDYVDMRVAFSEGWGSAFAALALGDPMYRDTGGFRQGGAFAFDVEGAGFDFYPPDGWFAEKSVWELIYDLSDAAADGSDSFQYPFADIWSVMTGRIVTTTAVTSIFPLLNAIKADHPGDQLLLDQLAADQDIGSVASDFGDNETNNAGSVDVLPLYTPLIVNNPGPAVNVCSTDEFTSGTTGSTNKLSSRRFLRFTPPAAGNVTISVTATSIPANEYSDPDFYVHRQGPIAISDAAPNAACMDINGVGWNPGNCAETATVSLARAEHVLEIYEWTNTNADDDPEYPPIGRTCFDVTVTQP